MRKNTSKRGRLPEKQSKKPETSGRTFKRAHAICRDHERYDEDTRDAIIRAISDNSPNLTELVRRAESGETILDITAKPGAPNKTQICNRHERQQCFSISSLDLLPDYATDEDWTTVVQAIHQLVTNDVTPSALYNDVMGFLNDHSSDLLNDLMKSPEVIVRILIAARDKEARNVS